jgi:outer membrane protein assembly factor BamB
VLPAAVLIVCSGFVVARASASPIDPVLSPVPEASASVNDWPGIHLNAQLTGYAPRATVTDTTAPKLGVGLAVNLYSPALASPVVAYDASLNKTLAYQGIDSGSVVAIDLASGRVAWSTSLGSAVLGTPVVANGALWVGTTADGTIYKLDATTGAVECSLNVGQMLFASPVAATPPGGIPSVYFGTVWRPGATGYVFAVDASNCRLEWKFTKFPRAVAVWDPLSFGVDATGRGRVYFGTSNADQAVYSLDASTGREIWRVQPDSAHGDYDIGSGVTISLPGVNGFADGIAYVPSKDGWVYALNLTTGTLVWKFDMNADAGVVEESLSTAALAGVDLVLGCTTGIYDLNALTGKKIWSYVTPGQSEVISSPAVSGPPGHAVVSFGDMSRYFRVLSLSTGKELYAYKAGSWIAAGPAVSGDNVVISSNDGFLYDFRPGGGNGAPPATALTWPADTAHVSNPNGRLTITGNASDPGGVGKVLIGVREGGLRGRWWDAASGSWHLAPVFDSAVLASPGATSSGWEFSFPVPSSGSTYVVQANAAAVDGVPDVRGAGEHFYVRPTASAPSVSANENFVVPGASLTVIGRGFEAGEETAFTVPGMPLGRVIASRDGSFVARLLVPADAVLGPASILVQGVSSGRESSWPIYISIRWPQFGGDPTRTGTEVNDSIIDDSIDPAQNILLDPAWRFSAAAGSLTSPAVVQGVAYAGDSADDVYAVNTASGKALWRWRTPSGKAITGAAAVDVTSGSVFVGAADGYLYALSTTGGQLWKYRVAATVPEAPALDPWGKVLVVTAPTATGSWVRELNASTGAELWTVSIPGSVGASPVIGGGMIYVGSSDHELYALSELNGSRIWSFTTGGPVEASAALFYSFVAFGSDDGNLYVAQAATGRLLVSMPTTIAARGVVVAGETVIEAGLHGTLVGARYSGNIVWSYATGERFSARPALANGTVYAASTVGHLYAFTPQGLPPL